MVDLGIKDNERKYKYFVSLSAEDETHGYVKLTKREAEIVSYATNERNWEDKESNLYSGSFYIDLEHPVEIENLKKELEYVENFFGELTDNEFMQMYEECANSNSETDQN